MNLNFMPLVVVIGLSVLAGGTFFFVKTKKKKSNEINPDPDADYLNDEDEDNGFFDIDEDKLEEDNDKQIRLSTNLTIEKGFVLDNISFKYAGSFSPYVLMDIKAQIPLHKVTAIVGASGSGKTTLLKLLLNFYYPQKGDLFLNNVKMKDIYSRD